MEGFSHLHKPSMDSKEQILFVYSGVTRPEKTPHFKEEIFGLQQTVNTCFFTVSLEVILSGGELTVPGLEVCPAAQVSTAIGRLSSSTGETYSWTQP